jgi:pimeloyl-ACP methyl ester carboxylesterase
MTPPSPSARVARRGVSSPSEMCFSPVSPRAWPAVLSPDELELLAERSIERVEGGGGWRFRWDRRVLDTEPVHPFAFLPDVRSPTRVMAGAQSSVMPPNKARRFAEAIPGATIELVDGAGHHVELEAPRVVADGILELARG